MVKKIAFLFPGQGSQSVGMAQGIFDQFPETKKFLDAADKILGFDISQLIQNGPIEELTSTQNAQPALFLTSVASFEALKALGISPNLAAGHSLGEYSALYAAGVFSFEDGLKLVRHRGELMAKAGESAPGSMAALIGLDEEKTAALCQEAAQKTGEPCVPANFNSSSQIVISGGVKAIQYAVSEAKGKGALKAIPLQVSGAFHSPLMSQAASQMKSFVDQIQFSDAAFPVVTNVDAQPEQSGEKFKEKLIQQIDHAVLWTQTLGVITKETESAIEVGAGKVLSGLVKKFDKRFPIFNTDGIDQIKDAFASPV